MQLALKKSSEGYSMPTYNARYPGFNENDYKKLEGMAMSRGLTGQQKTSFMDQAYQQYYPQVFNNYKLNERQEKINQGVAQNGTALLNGNKDIEYKMKLTDLSQRAKQAKGISYDVDDMQVINAMKNDIPDGENLLLNYLNNGDREIFYKAGIEEDPRERLRNNFRDALWDNIKTKAQVPVDTMKKWGQRTYIEGSAGIYQWLLKKTLGDKLSEQMGISLEGVVDPFMDKVITPRAREQIANYQTKVNDEYDSLQKKNLDQEIENYYQNKGFTKLLKEGDFKGFIYKSMGDAAQNWEVPAVVVASILQPEIGFTLMATDAYARENQEAFENMLANGATYEEAETGAVTVGLINAAVEVTLEKLLGGVETTASDTIRKTFMKNVQDEAVKKGLGKILVDGAWTQVKASGEEGFEELVQQIVQNAAVKTVNENQGLFEGVGEAFEGGFYNPMNLLAGGGHISQNVSQNKDVIRQQIMDGAYNAGAFMGNMKEDFTTNVFPKNNTQGQNGTATTNTQEGGIMDKITDWGAEKITDTVSAQDKLYKAQEPRMNTLTSKKNLEQRRQNSDRANQLIIENGYMPTNTSERLDAHKATLDKLWKQIETQINKGEGIEIDQTSIIDKLQAYIDEKKSLNVAAIDSEIAALEKELEFIKKSQEEGGVDLPILENRKQVYNDIIDWKEQEASDVYKGGLRLLTAEIGKIEDKLLAKVPGDFAKQKKDVGALLDTYEDVFKADMKNQRSKGMGLTEAYSRIEGVGDIIEGALGILSGQGGKVISGAGKVLLGKSLAKAKDVDFLIKQGYEALAKEMGKEVPTTTETTVETEVSEEKNSETPIYKSEKVDIIEPSLDTNLSQMETTNNYQTEEDLIKQEREELSKMRENKEEQARKDFQKQNLKEYMGDMEKGENIRVTFIKQGTNNIKYTTKVTVEKGDGYYMLKYDNGDIDFINDDEVNMWLDTKEVRGFNTVNPDVANSEESIMEILDREPNVPSIEEIRKEFVFEGDTMDDLKNGLQVELDNYSQNVDTWQKYNDREAQHKAAINRAYIEAYKEEIKEREDSPVMDTAEAKELLKNYSEEDFKKANEEYRAEKDLDEMTEEEVDAIHEQEWKDTIKNMKNGDSVRVTELVDGEEESFVVTRHSNGYDITDAGFIKDEEIGPNGLFSMDNVVDIEELGNLTKSALREPLQREGNEHRSVRAKIVPSDDNYWKRDGREIYDYLNTAENIEWNDKSHSADIKNYKVPSGKVFDVTIRFGSQRAYTMTKNRYEKGYYSQVPYEKSKSK